MRIDNLFGYKLFHWKQYGPKTPFLGGIQLLIEPLMDQVTLSVCIIYWKILMGAKVFTGQGNITNGCKRNVVKCDVKKRLHLRSK